jgi:hypothetical protein
MITITLQDRLNPKLDALAVVSQTPSYGSQPTSTVSTPAQSQQPATPLQNVQPTSAPTVRVSSLLMGQPIVAQALLVLSLLSSQTLLPS